MSVELLVVRHAIAFERDAKRWPDDGLRPLTPEGKRKFQQAAAGLARWISDIDRLFSSPLVRAVQTAEILTDAAGWPKAEIATELLPEEDSAAPLGLARKMKSGCVAVVGHEPQLSALVAHCIADDARVHTPLKKGGVARIQFDGRVTAGGGTLLALIPPAVLRRMA
jgi:phosphohistidine phosphatase